MDCPKCNKVAMETDTAGGVVIERCPNCQGLYLDEGEMESLLSSEAGRPIDSSEFTEISDHKDMELAFCRKCNVEMEPIWGPANMRIDRCPKCRGVFLDQGELTAIRSAT